MPDPTTRGVGGAPADPADPLSDDRLVMLRRSWQAVLDAHDEEPNPDALDVLALIGEVQHWREVHDKGAQGGPEPCVETEHGDHRWTCIACGIDTTTDPPAAPSEPWGGNSSPAVAGSGEAWVTTDPERVRLALAEAFDQPEGGWDLSIKAGVLADVAMNGLYAAGLLRPLSGSADTPKEGET